MTVGDGSSIFFWSDAWHGAPLKDQWPHLFSYVHEEFTLVKHFLSEGDKSIFFHTPMSIEAFDQYQVMITQLNNIVLTQDSDKWGYIWGSSTFTSSKAYYKLLGNISVPRVFKWLWNSDCLPKRKFFFWLVLQDRLSTR